MLRVPDRYLPESAAERLRAYQQEIDAVEDYADRVVEAKRQFRNRRNSPTLQEVRRALQTMCGGIRRCMYCEDSRADEIEHFRPRDLYPEAVFLWPNLLFACGPCNGNKRNRFLVFAATDGELVDVTRMAGSEILPPVAGEPVLIDPRHEEPLDLLELELRHTFRFAPRLRRDTRARARAERTIEVLKLNSDLLVKARRGTFESLIALLKRYLEKKRKGGTVEVLRRIRNAITLQPHPTVWAEMKRQYLRFDELARMFEQAPEALAW